MCQGPVPARLKTTQYPDIKNHEATSISLPSIRLAHTKLSSLAGEENH
jgi:hypothetical protein